MVTSIQEACEELAHKSQDQIQIDTALTWAYRACAAYKFARECKDAGQMGDSLKWLFDASEYEHEAFEHAGLVSDKMLKQIRKMIKDCQ